MKSKIILISLSACFLTACFNTNSHPQPIVDYTDTPHTNLSLDSILADTTTILTAHLPIYFDSTHVLIHTIGFAKIEKSDKFGSIVVKKKGGMGEYESAVSSSYNYITGNMTNLLFDDVDAKSSDLHLLTDNVLNITQIEYLREIGKNTKNHYLLYRVQDKDTNRDGKLNSYDITSLYISKLNGEDFAKVSGPNQNFTSGELVLWCNRYYFSTIEDINKDGKFDKRDKVYYYYIDLSTTPYKVVEYSPLEMVRK